MLEYTYLNVVIQAKKSQKKTIIARVKVVLTKVYKKVKSFCSELVQRKMTDIY